MGDFKRSTKLESPSLDEHILNITKYGDHMFLVKVLEKKNPQNRTATLNVEIFTVPHNELVF